MLNLALYRREMKGSVKLLITFLAILALYVSVIIGMYRPELMAMLDGFVRIMPQLMNAVGMKAGTTSLLGFLASYLYGFVLLIFPMVYSILRGHGLIAKYVDRGAMAALVAAPVKRRDIAITQMAALVSGILILVVFSTVLEFACAAISFPGELALSDLLLLNLGLLCLHLFISGVCFLASCVFSDARYSIGFGAGIPAIMYVLQMLANMGGTAEKAKYFTFFTLFDPNGIIARSTGALTGIAALLVGSIILYALAIAAFSKKDLHI